MKKRYTVFLALSLGLLLSAVILPSGFAERAEKAPIPSKPSAAPNPALPKAAAPAPRTSRRAAQAAPVSSRAVGFAVSPAVRDLPPEAEAKFDPEAEQNVKSNPNKIVRTEVENPNAVSQDPVIQSSGPATLSIPAASASFDGNSNQDNAALFGFRVSPPDTVGDVGPNHYVQMVNLTYRVFDKAGTPLTPARKVSSLFTALGAPCGAADDGDPIVLYDSLADRWMLSQFCWSTAVPNHQVIAVSKTGDPTGAYYLYDFVMPNLKFNDYPHFGVWPDGYYMTDNQFNQAGTAFLGGGAFAFDRGKMLAGDPTASYVYFDLEPLDASIGGMLPADHDGLTPPPVGAPNVFAYFVADEFGDPSDGIRLFEFHADFNTPANSTFIERADSPVAVAAFDPRNPAGRSDIEQPATTTGLDSIQDRLLHRLAYRNFGTHESIVATHTVNASGVTPNNQANHRAAVRYYELRRSLPGGNYAVPEQATFAPDTDNRWMGSAAQDNDGNLAVGYSVSSAATRPSVRYAGRLAGDPPNSLAQGEASIVAGTGSQTGSNRWGDYSAMSVDPSDDCTFWYTQEYYTAASQASSGVGWLTRIGSFKFAQCTPPQKGTIEVHVTNCETNLPVPGAQVSINNTLYGATNASGVNSSQVAPGSNYGVTVTAPLFFPQATLANVTDGNTTVVNLCLSGMPHIANDGSALTAESCDPADGALSPGETVSFDFALKNTGTAATSNLVATLQATGGVTAPSGAQPYGVLLPGGPSASRPFTFTVDPNAACGSTITATLQLQDGANNLGAVTHTFTLGGLALSPTTGGHSTGNLATAIPDLSTVDIPINVPDNGSITDVNVRFRLNHTFDGDLEIRLVHPDGTAVLLSDNRGSTGDNYGAGANDCSGTPTGFDDSAAPAISTGVAPFAGTFKPEQALSAFNGKSSAGTWKLRITDTANLDVGTVGCVRLEISRRRYVCCGLAGTPEMQAAPPATIAQESCSAGNGAIDPEETVTVNLPIRNVGDGATTNLVATLQPGGGVTPVTTSQNYGAVSSLNPPVSRPFTFVAQGSCGGQITATLQLQDGANNLGAISYTFTLGTAVPNNHGPFANAAAITIPAAGTSGVSSPYPSSINVAGIPGTVSKVTAKIKGFNHTFPGDVDVLLVGPAGQSVILMSDVGGTNDAVGVTVTFDDTAAAGIGAAVVTGTFKPTNSGSGDAFAAPAPAAPHGATMSVFNGANPNGAWRLFVVDDAGGDTGNFSGGWELSITTQDPVCCFQQCSITDPADINVPNDPGACGANVFFPAAVYAGSCGVVAFAPPSGSFCAIGVTPVTVQGTLADNTVADSESFNVTVSDTEGPAVGPASASPSSLWPPNHKMRDVTLSYTVGADNCGGAVGCVITGVASNEPADGTGDGDTSPDWVIVSPTKVQLRAERSGGGVGRTYTVTVRCTDSNGNHTFRTATVNVPHSQ